MYTVRLQLSVLNFLVANPSNEYSLIETEDGLCEKAATMINGKATCVIRMWRFCMYLKIPFYKLDDWDGEYYISKAEYCRFVDEHSNYLFSNILYLKEKKK